MKKTILSWDDAFKRAREMGDAILLPTKLSFPVPIYPIPRGGVPVALMMMHQHPNCFRLVDNPCDCKVFIDDIIDTGKTMDRYLKSWPDRLFAAMVDKQEDDPDIGWVVFPWESDAEKAGPAENIRRLIEFIGDDPNREGLIETPERVLRSYGELFGGYNMEPEEVLKTFDDDTCDEMVVLKNIEFASTCEHHLLPFTGRAHIAYIPNGRVVGISKLARLLEVYSRRLQIQERLTQDITTALDSVLKPLGSACVIEAKHLCMVCRGVNKQHSEMVTSSLTGVFREDNRARQEFLNFIRS